MLHETHVIKQAQHHSEVTLAHKPPAMKAFCTLVLQGGGQLHNMASLLLGKSSWYPFGILRASLDVAAKLLVLVRLWSRGRLSYVAQKAENFLTS
jgi:hypothetical protein